MRWISLVFAMSLLATVVFSMIWAANLDLFESSETADLSGSLALVSAVAALLSGVAAIVQAARDLTGPDDGDEEQSNGR